MTAAGADEKGLAREVARIIDQGFHEYEVEFQAITRNARRRFERRDWHGMQADSERRLDVYDRSVRLTRETLAALAGPRLGEKSLWHDALAAYSALTAGRRNAELAETFYNSITRKLFSGDSIDPGFEYLTLEQTIGLREPDPAIRRTIPYEGSTEACVARLLETCTFDVPWDDLRRDVRLVGEQIERVLAGRVDPRPVEALESLVPIFYRDKSAFVVGRLRAGPYVTPLVLALRNDERGLAVDAVLMSRDDVSVLFSFARAYFMVDAPSPRDVIAFLKTIMPAKPIAELYTSLGSNKHGKTELYRDLVRHLSRGEDRFRVAPGDAGMVMLVFTLEHFDIVFKVIRDEFPFPKQATRREVMDRYRLVFRRDRVGRLVDAQEFEHLRFARDLFDDGLLRELIEQGGKSVTLDGDQVVFSHLYTERRIRPLNLYLREASDDDARRAAIDYGYAIKELAAANIFPGDFLLKNFGVTRHGRVVFYDYDELCLVTDCRFRRMPEARSPEDELASEPWFTVGPMDIFPEEFRKFLGLDGVAGEAFLDYHEDLFTVEFWRGLQERHEAGETPDFHPYPPSRRVGAAGDEGFG